MSKLLDSLVYKAIEVLTRSREKAIIRNKIDQIKSSYSKLKVKKTLSKEQKEEIQDFYKKTL